MASDEEPYTALCARIVERCRLQGWYGPDGEQPLAWRDAKGITRVMNPANFDDPRTTWFAYPPATEEQLHETEATLGFPLPPLLRALYTQVANGGFGPAYGLVGARGGFPRELARADDGGETIEASPTQSWSSRVRLVELSDHDIEPPEIPWRGELPPRRWPAHFLHVANEGCGMAIYLDAGTDRVYLLDNIDPREFPARASVWDEPLWIERLAPSFDGWLSVWLQRELRRSSVVPGSLRLGPDRDDIPF